MLLADLVATSAEVAATRARTTKRAAIARLLREAPADDLPIVAPYLAGELRQRRIGVGWAGLQDLPAPATEPTLTVQEVDHAFAAMATLAGPGSTARRTASVVALFAAATADEQRFLRGLVVGDLRQGALDSVLLDAIAEASGCPATAVRRAAMLGGSSADVAVAALRGGVDALQEFTLVVGRPVRPMLAASAPDVEAAWQLLDGNVVVDIKLDGIRVQVHRSGGDVRVFSRSLDDITVRAPQVVAQVLELPCDTVVLDGEALLVDGAGRPRLFQETAARSASGSGDEDLQAFFFDLLHLDGADLMDLPLGDRLERLRAVVPPSAATRLSAPGSPAQAQAFFDLAVTDGFEGVVVKALDAPYVAGRRGSGWIKVKPRHTLDLVVLAVEWGSGRRRGSLSNIHLGARSDDGFVMLGKTFKGMTDEMLAWQTQRFLELETHREGHIVHVRPEQVVEIAFDGVQRSTRYPGGVALRFARVLGYRDDKLPGEADPIEAVQALLSGG